MLREDLFRCRVAADAGKDRAAARDAGVSTCEEERIVADVEEQADHAVSLGPQPLRDRASEDDLLLAGVAAEEGGERRRLHQQREIDVHGASQLGPIAAIARRWAAR